MWERRAAAQPSTAERRRQNVTHPNSVKVSVSDTGPGIPAEFHLEVFDDFFRLPGTEARKAWDWASPSRAAWCKAWEARSGSRAIPAQAASFLSSSHTNRLSSPPARGKTDEANRQDPAGRRRTRHAALHQDAARSGRLQSRNRDHRRGSSAARRKRLAARPGAARRAHARHRRPADSRDNCARSSPASRSSCCPASTTRAKSYTR